MYSTACFLLIPPLQAVQAVQLSVQAACLHVWLNPKLHLCSQARSTETDSLGLALMIQEMKINCCVWGFPKAREQMSLDYKETSRLKNSPV